MIDTKELIDGICKVLEELRNNQTNKFDEIDKQLAARIIADVQKSIKEYQKHRERTFLFGGMANLAYIENLKKQNIGNQCEGCVFHKEQKSEIGG